LPLNDPAGKNAIHGFACRRPWRVVSQGADDAAAWVTGEFRLSQDAPEARDLWPADCTIRVTYWLQWKSLRIQAVVENPDRVHLPFGLGYHPYFQTPPTPGRNASECFVAADAARYWELRDSLPTGTLLPVDMARDLRSRRPVLDLPLDDVFHPEPGGKEFAPDLVVRGSLWEGAGLRAFLRLETAPDFRELVVFTPPHRQAIALEPYTCTTDAINLQQQGVDAGLRVLEPGEQWAGEVRLTYLGGAG
jgi:aldose 1-epimerase